MTIYKELDASAPHQASAMAVAVRLTDALKGRTAAAAVKPPQPKSKF